MHLYSAYLTFESKQLVGNILWTLLLFIFGATLNDHPKKGGDTWIRKFAVTIVYVLVLLQFLGIFKIAVINNALAAIGVNSIVYYMLFIYFGYLFFA